LHYTLLTSHRGIRFAVRLVTTSVACKQHTCQVYQRCRLPSSIHKDFRCCTFQPKNAVCRQNMHFLTPQETIQTEVALVI